MVNYEKNTQYRVSVYKKTCKTEMKETFLYLLWILSSFHSTAKSRGKKKKKINSKPTNKQRQKNKPTF